MRHVPRGSLYRYDAVEECVADAGVTERLVPVAASGCTRFGGGGGAVWRIWRSGTCTGGCATAVQGTDITGKWQSDKTPTELRSSAAFKGQSGRTSQSSAMADLCPAKRR